MASAWIITRARPTTGNELAYKRKMTRHSWHPRKPAPLNAFLNASLLAVRCALWANTNTNTTLASPATLELEYIS